MFATLKVQLSLSRPYLTRNELQQAYKNTIPDRRSYMQRKLVIFKFMSDICVQFQFPRKTLETAFYYYQRYYVFNKFETEMCHTVATTALLLSCKQVETFKKINELCIVSFRLRNINNINQDIIENFKKRIFQVELRLLEACCFDYRVNNRIHIDEYIVKFGKHLGFTYELCHLSWVISYDILKTDLLLILPQHTIALAILKVAFELLKLKDWPVNDYEKFKTNNDSINEAYFGVLNYYINAFDSCNLKDHTSSKFPPVSLEVFMQLKANSSPETGLKDFTMKETEEDKYLTTARDFTQRERRYVLSSKFVKEENAIINAKKRKLK
ncbi:hypothetical protein Kpol_1004p15 [Vanderwaltozyma polyspora DSM 70294]|uniref:Cyclin-like domain-containing protein n=1 Tax=Vanderwaltozyma polyspora (strain ATCC 22028 / DSM 70294 / BCRC 21397 / CBS 2163 / NBRC 10782 / NRRL Y-8283 / UCD 57-17) TaxID=436907 RepID=A7TJ72_VANPO|nr:uncharacterized protein Kpol_1004p15 [Vanderwaltozyma polyspora DSM 70294]EDO17641.1 hypothetical protein Kpol_1004p15 [Vanderwaltozyma polyspora DSM 70294]